MSYYDSVSVKEFRELPQRRCMSLQFSWACFYCTTAKLEGSNAGPRELQTHTHGLCGRSRGSFTDTDSWYILQLTIFAHTLTHSFSTRAPSRRTLSASTLGAHSRCTLSAHTLSAPSWRMDPLDSHSQRMMLIIISLSLTVITFTCRQNSFFCLLMLKAL